MEEDSDDTPNQAKEDGRKEKKSTLSAEQKIILWKALHLLVDEEDLVPVRPETAKIFEQHVDTFSSLPAQANDPGVLNTALQKSHEPDKAIENTNDIRDVLTSFEWKCDSFLERVLSFMNAFRYIGGGRDVMSNEFHIKNGVGYFRFVMNSCVDTLLSDYSSGNVDERRHRIASVLFDVRTEINGLHEVLSTFHTTLSAFLTMAQVTDSSCLKPLSKLCDALQDWKDNLAKEFIFPESETLPESFPDSIPALSADDEAPTRDVFTASNGRKITIDLLLDFNSLSEKVAEGLQEFTNSGIPIIQEAQQVQLSRFINLTAIATFFAAVVATTLQLHYSVSETRSALHTVISSCWFCSLVSSISSALNSLLGITWRRSSISRPISKLPLWAAIWIDYSPMYSLAVASVTFALGLIVFAFSTSQSPITIAIATAFTVINSCTLVALSLWYVADKLDWSPSFRFARKDSKPKSSPPKSKQENSDNQEKPLEETAEDDEHPGGITAFADSSKGIAASLPWIPDYRRNPPVSAGTEKTEGQHLSTLEEFSLNARTYLERSKSDIVIPMVPQSSHSSVNDG